MSKLEDDLIKALDKAEVGLWIALAFAVVGLVCQVLAIVLKEMGR